MKGAVRSRRARLARYGEASSSSSSSSSSFFLPPRGPGHGGRRGLFSARRFPVSFLVPAAIALRRLPFAGWPFPAGHIAFFPAAAVAAGLFPDIFSKKKCSIDAVLRVTIRKIGIDTKAGMCPEPRRAFPKKGQKNFGPAEALFHRPLGEGRGLSDRTGGLIPAGLAFTPLPTRRRPGPRKGGAPTRYAPACGARILFDNASWSSRRHGSRSGSARKVSVAPLACGGFLRLAFP